MAAIHPALGLFFLIVSVTFSLLLMERIVTGGRSPPSMERHSILDLVKGITEGSGALPALKCFCAEVYQTLSSLLGSDLSATVSGRGCSEHFMELCGKQVEGIVCGRSGLSLASVHGSKQSVLLQKKLQTLWPQAARVLDTLEAAQWCRGCVLGP